MHILLFGSRFEGQVFLEFVLTFFLLLLFVCATAIIFVWFGNSIVNRNTEYQKTRMPAGNVSTANASVDFYNQSKDPLKILD